MKKMLSIFIAVIYLATSSGMALQVHYCMDKVSGIGLITEKNGSCGQCGMEKAANACCKDELKFLKLEDAHKLLSTAYQFHPPVASVTNRPLLVNTFFNTAVPASVFNAHAPPEKAGQAIYILHCVFRV